MNISVKSELFNGFGVRLIKNKLYVCAYLPYKINSGIHFYAKNDTNQTLFSVEFDDTFYIGDVVCVSIQGRDFDNLYYSFYADNEKVIDKYTFSFDEKIGLSRIVSLDLDRLKSCNNKIQTSFEKSFFYLLNIRGFTMMDTSVRTAKGTFKGCEKKIRYLKNLGVTAVITMPLYSVIPYSDLDYRCDCSKKVEKANYWGFGEGLHFSVNSNLSYSEDPCFELRDLISEFHKNDIEFIPMMQFEKNTKIEYILDVLKYWLLFYNVDGFRFIGENIPSLEIANYPLFHNIKILCDNIDGNGYKPDYMLKYKNLGIFDNRFLQFSRRFLKGDEDTVSYMSYAVRENSKFYSPIRYITDFSGFTLYDLVSYNVKHNEMNLESNVDGTDYNYSWNCGEEGPSKQKKVNSLRFKQMKNAMMICFLSQGVPMIYAGDECFNSQNGNNNPYCQDNEIGWTNYKKDKTSKAFYDFIKNLASFRKRHVVLHQPKELMMFDYISCKIPDVSYHSSEAFKMDSSPFSRAFAVLYCGDYSRQYINTTEESVYIVYNMYWEPYEFALPIINKNRKWKYLYSTADTFNVDFDEAFAVDFDDKSYVAAPRSVSVFLLST